MHSGAGKDPDPTGRWGWWLAGVLVLAAAVRFCHLDVIWVEEGYPTAAAMQLLHGKALYRDIWFDKPPLFAWLYLLWGAHTGWALRLAGALFVMAASACAAFATRGWRQNSRLQERQTAPAELLAAGFTAFFLTFDIPAAVMALTPDLLLVPFHLLAVGFALRRRPGLAGMCAGFGFGFNAKAVLVAAACAVVLAASSWLPPTRQDPPAGRLSRILRDCGWLAAGAIIPVLLLAALLQSQGALRACWEQVFVWSSIYSSNSFIEHPWPEGLRRTGNWLGFHAVLTSGVVLWLLRRRQLQQADATGRPIEPRGFESSAAPAQRERADGQARDVVVWLIWVGLSLIAVCLGSRFFPRYYFHLLPPMAISGALGWSGTSRKCLWIAMLLLLLPLARFGPPSARLAWETWHGEPHRWADLALEQDSHRAAALLRGSAKTGETLLVWGYRPELFPLSGLAAGTPYLDSQPLSGVLADRHLSDATVTYPEWSKRNREALLQQRPPDWIADGLGPMNGALSVFGPHGLEQWSNLYQRVGSTATYVLYHRR